MEIGAEILIQAARNAVWRRFEDVAAWPSWHERIQAAQWRGPAWTDGAQLQLRVTPLFWAVTVHAQIKTVSIPNLVVWESRLPGLTAVHVFDFSDSLGGCLVREKETYHGSFVALASPLLSRQRQAFQRSLHNLKALIEGNRAQETGR